MTRPIRRVGIVLFQLGGPDTLEAIEPFLYNLFCDPDIIDFPFARLGRKPLAKLISTTRARKVQHHYASIGGGSPIRRNTERQARALEAALRTQGIDAHCFVAMRYWHPFTSKRRSRRCTRQRAMNWFSCRFTRSTRRRRADQASTNGSRLFADDIPTHCVQTFYRHPAYLDAMAEKVNEALARFADPSRAEIVFSAHGVPLSVIQKGDPYQEQIEDTVRLLMERGAWSNPHRLCYQSKVGASRLAAAFPAPDAAYAEFREGARRLCRSDRICLRSRRDPWGD